MTLAIKTCDVSAVLLADGWHEVEPGSFTVQRLAFTDADGIEHRKAARKLGYRFLEQCRSLGTLQTVVVAGPMKAILAVRTTTQVPEGAQRTSVPAPATVPDSPSRYEARGTEPVVHAPEKPVPLQESIPALPPRFEWDDGEASVPVPASDPGSSGRFEREPEQPLAQFRVSEGEPSDTVPASVPDQPTRGEAPAQRPELDPEHSTPWQIAKSSTQTMTSILLRDEMERDRLARAGHPVSEGLRLSNLGPVRSVGDGDDEVLDG